MPQPESNEDRIIGGDKEYFSFGVISASYNEAHAMQLGVVGMFSGVAYSAGLVDQALGITTVLFLTALGVRAVPGKVRGKEIPIAIKTTRHEPWWFISSYSVTFIVGAVISSII